MGGKRMDLIRVGRFELYPSERMLCAAGKPIELGARAFDMLLVLVEHQGRLVSKTTLLERVWPRLVVDENNIPAQVASLRRVLGVGAIRTVQGFGYRLGLEVVRPGSSEQPAASPGTLREDLPPQHSAQRRTWPNRLGPLVGRDADVCAVREALGRSWLVTIVGIAGVGKTRLAQEILAAEAEMSGVEVAWVSLAPLTDVQSVPSAIALALGLSLADGINGFTALHQAIQGMSLLLVLDCAEHFADALATPLAGLVLQTRGVRALVTSQAPLGLTGEIVYRLAALSVPQPGLSPSEAGQFAAISLFAQRAMGADRRFELTTANTSIVVEICRRLDGIPLAIELAAARVPALGLATVLDRLNDRFRLLKVTGCSLDQRHSALHTAFDWSYSLLTPSEQTVFNKLGTFAGSFSLKTAAACVKDGNVDTSEAMDLIGRLVDRSLVTALAVEPPRYALLETARYYALEKLAAADELQTSRGRMAATMLDVLELAYQEYWSLDEAVWLNCYEAELDNVRAAMEWANRQDPELGVALFGSAWPLFVEMDLHAEGRARYSQVLSLLSDGLSRARTARFWEAIATYDSTRQCDRARYAAELAATMYAATGDTRSHYYALMLLAGNWRVDTESARSTYETARRLEDPAWPARLLAFGALTAGALLTSGGQFAEARAAYKRAVTFALTTSERQALVATVNIVELDVACGDTQGALQLGRPLALSLQHLGRRETHFELLNTLFSALLIAGETLEARSTGRELLDLATRFDTSKLYMVLDAMAFLACKDEHYEMAALIASCADAAHEAHGQARRRPVEEHVRRCVAAMLDEHLGNAWHTCSADRPMNEAAACAFVLGVEIPAQKAH
jgi:predicted ATPase/DNA-binding winged helix-turn-helix (wHTH) protein